MPPAGAGGQPRRVPVLAALFLFGLALRLAGLPFNGMYDLDEIIFIWGGEVHTHGLATAFKINYGLLSYAFAGLFHALGEFTPRFWWLSYKLTEIGFEIGMLWVLYRLLPVRLAWLALALFWLNPWFILHGAWHGFWEGPHVFLGLLAVLALRRIADERRAWFAVGILLMTSAMFKPQGLVHFVAPLGLYLGIQFLRARQAGLVWYVAGLATVFAGGTLWITGVGGPVTAIADNYLSAMTSMPNLCSSCLNGWRAVSYLLLQWLDQPGYSEHLILPRQWSIPLHGLATLLTLTALLILAWRVRLRSVLHLQIGRAWPARDDGAVLPPDRALLIVLALSSLIMSQLGARAHVNHSYAALVLLLPLVVEQRRLLAAWLGMVAIHFYAHLATFQLGRSVVLPTRPLPDPAAAEPLVSAIRAALANDPHAGLLRWQESINGWLPTQSGAEPLLAILALAQTACAIFCMVQLLARTTSDLSRPGIGMAAQRA